MKSIPFLIPKLTSSLRKGDCGKVAVFGGSLEYTGAPYFAAKASLLTGADLVSVFCTKDSGQVIKSFCPELIVYPILEDSRSASSEVSNCISRIVKMLPNYDSAVIGPGLGRDAVTFGIVQEIINHLVELDISLVLDADGLFLLHLDLLKQQPEMVLSSSCILTPNFNEFKRLLDSLKLEDSDQAGRKLSVALHGATVLRKGNTDMIYSGESYSICEEPGALRRVGGQGDILAGCIATFLAWERRTKGRENGIARCAFAGAQLTRRAAKTAFESKGRAMVTTDILNSIGNEFARLY